MGTMRKNKNCAQGLAIALCAAMAFSTTVVPAEAKAKQPKLSTTSVTVKVGKTKKVTVKNATKVTWKIKSGKANIALLKKSKKGATIKGVKAGSAKISVTMKGGKKVPKTINVKVTPDSNKGNNATPTPSATAPAPSAASTAATTETPAPTPRTKKVQDIILEAKDFEAAGVDCTFEGGHWAVKLMSDEEENPYNLLKKKDDRFDLKYFESVVVKIDCDIDEDEDMGSWTGGKVAICNNLDEVTGTNDGNAYNWNLNDNNGNHVYTLSFADRGQDRDDTDYDDYGYYVEGQCAGLNLQFWDDTNDYESPACLKGGSIRWIIFNAIPGAEYPTT